MDREARNKWQREWRRKNPDKVKAAAKRANKRARIRKYQLSLEQHEELLAHQRHRCAICGIPSTPEKPLAIDHDHSTGLIRGLLCSRCNSMLGFAQDDPGILLAGRAYLLGQNAQSEISP
jgi:hypothetical protein